MKKFVALVLAAIMTLSLASVAFAATGIGAYTTVSSTAATADAAGKVAVDTTICAVTFDENRVITGIMFDATQPAAGFDATGALTVDAEQVTPTKRERGMGYNMKGVSPIGLEWFEQMDALEAWCIGKTVEEVLALELDEQNHATDADVLSFCTIHINAQLAAFKAAVEAAK